MKPGWVRIIAGEWRGRKLQVLDLPGLRPTPDRVRETVFNWLAPLLPGAICLDMYAGTGVLGFEALSRGAKQVVMVDQSAAIVANLQVQVLHFKAENALVYQATLPQGLKRHHAAYNVVFIDPPYQAGLLLPSCQFLEEQNFLANPAYIYLEADRRIHDNELPATWSIEKFKQAGHVYYHLAKREFK